MLSRRDSQSVQCTKWSSCVYQWCTGRWCHTYCSNCCRGYYRGNLPLAGIDGYEHFSYPGTLLFGVLALALLCLNIKLYLILPTGLLWFLFIEIYAVTLCLASISRLSYVFELYLARRMGERDEQDASELRLHAELQRLTELSPTLAASTNLPRELGRIIVRYDHLPPLPPFSPTLYGSFYV